MKKTAGRATPPPRAAAVSLPRKTVKDLERRHLAFLEERLTGARAREDWIRALVRGYDEVREARIRDVVDPATLARHLQHALTAERVHRFFAPVLRDVQREVLASLRADRTPLGAYVPDEARAAVEAVLGRRGLVPEALVRKVFEQQAIVDAIHDTLHEGLTQFNTTVNPFFAEWGLPAILRRMPIGGGLILASMDAMRAEFDRRLEPEIRKFLAPFSKRAAGELTEAVLARSGDPKFVELRRNLLEFLYTQAVADLLAGIDDKVLGGAASAAEHVTAGLLERASFADDLERATAAFVEERGEATIGEWLDNTGATGGPGVEAWAELLWPGVEAILDSAVMRDWLHSLTAEFYDSLVD